MRRPPDPAYLDAEDCNEHVREQVRALIPLGYDHDRRGGLPLRPEVAGFVLNALCRPGSGWLRPADAALPDVRLRRDGTLVLLWREGRRWLRLRVPTLDVVIATTVEDGCEITVRLGDSPAECRAELARMFRWLLGDD